MDLFPLAAVLAAFILLDFWWHVRRDFLEFPWDPGLRTDPTGTSTRSAESQHWLSPGASKWGFPRSAVQKNTCFLRLLSFLAESEPDCTAG